jgi:hypothetical protein
VRRSDAPGLLLALAALAGCSVFDSRSDVSLVLSSPPRSQGHFTVSVVARGAAEATLLIDGTPLPQAVPTSTELALDLSQNGEGTHTLQARLYDGESRRESRRLHVVVDRTRPTMEVFPPQGDAYSAPGQAFVVDVRFSEEVDPASIRPDTVQARWVSSFPPVEITRTLSADRRHLRVELPSMANTRTVYLQVSVADLMGLAGEGVFTWTYRPVEVTLVEPYLSPSGLSMVKGPVRLVATWWNPGQVPRVQFLVDGSVIGSLQANVPFVWDSRTVTDGPHRIDAVADGLPVGSWQLIVRNSGPRLVSCAPDVPQGSDASAAAAYLITFDQPVCLGAVALGACSGSLVSPGTVRLAGLDTYPGMFSSIWDWAPGSAGPGTYTVSFAVAQGATGVPLQGPAECTMTISEWRAPVGDVLPAEVAGGGQVLVDWTGSAAVGWSGLNLVRIAPPGASPTASVEQWRNVLDGRWTEVTAAPIGAPFLAGSELRASGERANWLELDPAGGGRIRSAWIDRSTNVLYPPETALDIPAATGPVELAANGVAWTQPGPSGARQLSSAFEPWLGLGWTITSPVNVDPLADASQGWLHSQGYMAYVETPTGGVGQLRVRRLQSGTWSSLGDVLNRDPALTPSEPTFGLTAPQGIPIPVVAWVEDGKIMARSWSDLDGWSAAKFLSAFSGGIGRAPRLFYDWSGLHLLFIEGAAGGDRFEFRHFDEVTSGWRTLSPLPTSGAVVRVSTAAMGSGTAILWEDALGESRIRTRN